MENEGPCVITEDMAASIFKRLSEIAKDGRALSERPPFHQLIEEVGGEGEALVYYMKLIAGGLTRSHPAKGRGAGVARAGVENALDLFIRTRVNMGDLPGFSRTLDLGMICGLMIVATYLKTCEENAMLNDLPAAGTA